MGFGGVVAGWLNTLLGPWGVEVRRAGSSPRAEEMPRFLALARLAQRVESVPGAVVECGVGGGDSLRLLGWLMPGRALWGFDSFRGYPALAGLDGAWRLPEALVQLRLRRAGVAVRLVPGWFGDTLPSWRGPIAFLHVDANLEPSTREALDWLWPWLAPGAVAVLDDYGALKWPGVKRAADAFAAEAGCQVHADPARRLAWLERA